MKSTGAAHEGRAKADIGIYLYSGRARSSVKINDDSTMYGKSEGMTCLTQDESAVRADSAAALSYFSRRKTAISVSAAKRFFFDSMISSDVPLSAVA